jgi:aminocarboxymuconate-semialdehyde decarboxylase
MPDRKTIDIHAHYYPEEFLKLIEEEGAPFDAAVDRSNPKGFSIKLGKMQMPPLQASFTDLEARIADMDERKVDVHALSLTVPMVYWAGRDLGPKLCRAFNDGIAAAHVAHPDRLIGFAVPPMHEPDLAVEEVDRIADMPGMRGVYAATHVRDRELSDEAFFPVYERLEEYGLPLFLHPVRVIGAERLSRWHFVNTLGNPFDNAVAAAYLIFDGILDRFPKLEICLPHAGGALISVIGRMAHAWKEIPPLREKIPDKSPEEYLTRFYYDTITHDGPLLAYLIDRVGADRVMLGSDYCFGMGYDYPVEIVTEHAGIDEEAQALILGGNASRLLRLDEGS